MASKDTAVREALTTLVLDIALLEDGESVEIHKGTGEWYIALRGGLDYIVFEATGSSFGEAYDAFIAELSEG